MATLYVIDSTDGSKSILIKPGALNGPGSGQRDSDLRLYGMGALQWGEGIDENLYRLSENFSCPEKVLGDYNPNTSANDYDPATDPILPKDEIDLGIGNGLSKPLNGQLWYNSTKKTIYVYDATVPRWSTASGLFSGGTAPNNPQTGDLWYDTAGSDPQGCITEPTLKIYNPLHPEAAPDGFVLVGENFVRQCGDWMSGQLDMGGSDAGATSRFKIVNLGDPIDPFDSVHKQYVDNIQGGITTHISDDSIHLTSDQNTWLDGLNIPTLTATEVNYLIGVTNPIQTQLDGKVNLTGDTMTGFLTLNADPVSILHAATKQYVDTTVTSAIDGQLLSIDNIIYKSFFDINTSASTVIPGFNVIVNVTQAPVQFFVNSTLHVYLKGPGGGHAAYFDVLVSGGEYGSGVLIARVSPEGTQLANFVIPSTMTGSGILAQNTTYTFTVRGRNSSLLPNQDVRLNTTDSTGGAVADPFVQSTLEVTTFS
jgi:hypothetical protein